MPVTPADATPLRDAAAFATATLPLALFRHAMPWLTLPAISYAIQMIRHYAS
jgi:hypothetical protein